MFSEVPITTLLEMWEKVQTEASLLAGRVISLESDEGTYGVLF